jgi:four helix bundle protein
MPDSNEKPFPIEDRTYDFALALIRAYRAQSPRDDADKIIWHQLLESGSSAGANSAESPGAQSRPDWLTRRFIALKEMREAHFWLRLYRDANQSKRPDIAELLDESNQMVAILTTIVVNARRKKKPESGS